MFTTIYGTGFCFSSLQALKLLWSNVGRAVVISGISKYVELFGKLAIAAVTTGICILYMNYDDYLKDNLSSLVFPCIVIFILSYAIGSLFMMVLEVGVDTIFLCYLVDESVHGSAIFASESLVAVTAKTIQHHKSTSQNYAGQGEQTYTAYQGTDVNMSTQV